MFTGSSWCKVYSPAGTLVLLALSITVHAQSTATLLGRVVDPHGASVPAAKITAINQETQASRVGETDSDGNYIISALPVGKYRVEVQATGFRTQLAEHVVIEVSRLIVQNFQLTIGPIEQVVTIAADSPLIERATISMGHVVDRRTIQETPLNGRYFLDLGVLALGSVTPPQNGFATTPVRGAGSFAINTAGNREEAVNYLVNGITLNNLWFNSIAFQPSVSSVQEFKVDNSAFGAEYGQNSGAVVSIATRSGGNDFHGELFEYFRNNALDARNFFDLTSSEPPRFNRNLFGASAGGPISRNQTFFFFSYEGLRHRQGLNLNSLVLSDAERAGVSDPAIAKVIKLIPRANFSDSAGGARFIGIATAPVDVDYWTIDVLHNLTPRDQLHGYYAIQQRDFMEPNRFGNTLPGFGNTNSSLRQILTVNTTHTFNVQLVNEMRFGFNRISAVDRPTAQLNPAEFNILNGIDEPIGLPQISIAGNGLNFGGPSVLPQAREDTFLVIADTMNWLRGRHSLKLGGEYRIYLNNLARQSTGSFNFPTVAAFLSNNANSFSVTLGDQSSRVTQGALGFFVQDIFKLRPRLTVELGLRYDWNITPVERDDGFIVFDPHSISLLRVGRDIDEIHHQNNQNLQPRVGLAWDPWGDGKTSMRVAYAVLVDQPPTSLVTPTTANPPLAIPLTFTGPVRFDNALALAQPVGLAPQTIDHGFNNAYMQSWNLNVQRELARNVVMMLGYFGSKGTHLTLRRNLNQPVNGVRPFPALSTSSPILPGTPLGNITQVESSGNSSYNALWVNARNRLTRGLQFDVSYTWSKSLDYNSLTLQGIVVQNSYDLKSNRGLSDFDARHRFVVSTIYDLPFAGNWLISGWRLAAVVQLQSGNPVNVVTGDSSVNGVTGTLRPDVNGQIAIIGSVDRWFDTSVLIPVSGFGNLGRNVITGPSFNNTDVSVIKSTRLTDKIDIDFRAEFFDVFNHANFGQPGNVVGSPAFGRITNTRFPTGEMGSSRQIQFGTKVTF